MIIRPGLCVAKTFPNALGFKEERRLPTVGWEALGGEAPPLPSHPSASQQGAEPGSVTVQKESCLRTRQSSLANPKHVPVVLK